MFEPTVIETAFAIIESPMGKGDHRRSAAKNKPNGWRNGSMPGPTVFI